MSDQVPDLGVDAINAADTGCGPDTASAESVWGSLRELGKWDLIRLLPGVIRSALSRGGLESPGGQALRRPKDREADHLPDVGLDSAVTAEDLAAALLADAGTAETVDVAEAGESDTADLLGQLAEVLDLDTDADVTAAQTAQAAQAAEAVAVAEESADVDEAGLA